MRAAMTFAAVSFVPGLLVILGVLAAEPPKPEVWRQPEHGPQALFVIGAVDGDTLSCAYLVPVTVRVNGINAPEIRTAPGRQAKMFLSAMIDGKLVAATLHGREKYGRLLADIHVNGRPLSDVMIEAGHAKPWDGRGERP